MTQAIQLLLYGHPRAEPVLDLIGDGDPASFTHFHLSDTLPAYENYQKTGGY